MIHMNTSQSTFKTRLFFKERGFVEPEGYVKDHAFIRAKGEWHLFYIGGKRENNILWQRDSYIGHASTKDFHEWKVYKPAFVKPGIGHACYVVKRENLYYLFYGWKGLSVATSIDLENWEDYSRNPIFKPDLVNTEDVMWKKFAHFRDFNVIKERGKYHIFYTAFSKRGLGCVGTAESKDLLSWKENQPIYEFDFGTNAGTTRSSLFWAIGEGVPESPLVMRKNGWWHLFFTDNSFPCIYHFWARKMKGQWTLERSQKFISNPHGFNADLSANEIIETDDGDFVSYYYTNLDTNRHELKIERIKWVGPIPVIIGEKEKGVSRAKCITKWHVIGPFDNPVDGEGRRKGLRVAYAPEKHPGLDNRCLGKDGKLVKWKQINKAAISPNGLISLTRHYGKTALDYSVAYACAEINQDREKEVKVGVGSRDGIKVWINDTEVLVNPKTNNDAFQDEAIAVVRLRKGKNRILVKVEHGLGWWCFFFRIEKTPVFK